MIRKNDEMKKPRNTTQEANDNPLAMLCEAVLFGGSNAIEMSEQCGQDELVNSTALPSQLLHAHEGTAELLLSWGFEFGEPFEDDKLFRPANLPDGWSKQASDHAMWSHVVDDRGRKRVAVFYKAAFYDRKAHMRVEPRYRVDYADPPDGCDYHKKLTDSKTGEVLFECKGSYHAGDHSDKIDEFASEHLPQDWRHPKHWDA